MGFKPQKEYRPIHKKPTASSSGNKKKGVEPTIEVSNSNPFDVLNSVDNDVEFGTNEGTTNLVNNGATSSGSSFINVDNSSSGTTPIIDKIKKFEDLLTSGQAILVDKDGNPLKKVDMRLGGQSWEPVQSEDRVLQAANRIGCGVLKAPFAYLGLKVGGNMSRIKSWDETVDKMVDSCKNNFLVAVIWYDGQCP
ncbi:hypothetical protein Tco_0808064 [Tanacetum coccineum]